VVNDELLASRAKTREGSGEDLLWYNQLSKCFVRSHNKPITHRTEPVGTSKSRMEDKCV
jgi:hypothetical protein